MALPSAWVDHLFAKLTVRYGQAFLRQWPDADPVLVKADWAEVLDGVSGESLSYALKNLPDKPVNVMQFRDLCRAGAQERKPAALPAPEVKPDPKAVANALEKMNSAKAKQSAKLPAQVCLDNIAERVIDRSGYVSPAQLHMVKHCLMVSGTVLPDGLRHIADLESPLDSVEPP